MAISDSHVSCRLGLLVNPSELLLPWHGVGLLVGIFMILIEPLSVLISLLPFKNMSFKARLFTSRFGVAWCCAHYFCYLSPWISDVPQAKMMFKYCIFITILSLAVVQGTTVSSIMARWLGLSLPVPPTRKLKEFDVEFSDEIKSAMCEITVNDTMLKNGRRVMDIAYA